jgi:hypothetical protein
MPLDGHRLIIHPRYQMAKEFSEIGRPAPEPDDGKAVLRNEFWSTRHRCHVVIWDEDDKVQWGPVPGFHHLDHDIRTLGASVAWGLEQEGNAVKLLATMLRHHQFKQYLLTGMFLETSRRSGLTYMFRKLKPTVVIDGRVGHSKYRIGATAAEPTDDSSATILCTLCMHAIAYYERSWAGAMVPTDDVIAALALMRGDEHMLWKRANQTPPGRPEAGL